MRRTNGKLLGTASAIVMPIVGGGFLTGGNYNLAGTVMTHSTDGGGGYVWGPGDKEWRRVNTLDTFPAYPPAVKQDAAMPNGQYAESPLGSGVYAIAIAPSSETRGYMHWCGRFFRTDDCFRTISLIADSDVPGYPNGGNQRLFNNKLVIDPQNPDVFMLGSEGKGAYRSLTGGPLTKVAGIADVSFQPGDIPLPVLVAVDPTSSVAGGVTQVWALGVPDDGVYLSSTGPAGSFTKTAGGPVRMNHILFDKWTGDLYVCDGYSNDPAIWRLPKGGVWTRVAQNTANFKPQCIVIDNFNPKFKFVVGTGNNIISTDGNGDWMGGDFSGIYPYTFNYVGGRSKWQTQFGDMSKPPNAGRNGAYIFPSLVLPHPVTPNLYGQWHGTGWAEFSVPSQTAFGFGGELTYYDRSQGNEMLVTNQLVKAPGIPVISCNWDKGFYRHDDPNTAPDHHFGTVGLDHGWNIDYAPEDPTWMAGVVNYNTQRIGYCTDAGATKDSWNVFANQYPGGYTLGGDVGVPQKNHAIFVPSNNGRPFYTKDAGATPCQFVQFALLNGATMPTSGDMGWNGAYYFIKKNVLASKNQPGRIFLYNNGGSLEGAQKGLYESQAGVDGVFQQMFSGRIAGASGGDYAFYPKMRETPGYAGHVWLSGENDGCRFVRSTDWFRTITPVVTTYQGAQRPVTAVKDFNFGAPAPGGSGYPSMRFAGNVGSEYGIWHSDDAMATVRKVDTHPRNLCDGINCIAGHEAIYDEWYYGIGSTSYTRATRVQVLTGR